MNRFLSAGLMGLCVTLPAVAHEGHGLPGAGHWHASDALGFLLVGGALAWAVWRGRK